MADQDRRRKNRNALWVAIGAIVLIVLLLVWLTMADFAGDTDVAACISPLAVVHFMGYVR